MYKWLIGVIFALWLTLAASDTTRKVSPLAVNPNCPMEVDCDKPWIVHLASSDGDNTTLHHLWGAVGAPTFMTAVTSQEAELKIIWEDFNSSKAYSVSLGEDTDVEYTFGIVISNMILFNDVNDTGNIDNIPKDSRIDVPMADFAWNITQVFNSSAHVGGVVFETVEFQGEPLPDNAKISIQILAYGDEGRSSALPHLITTVDSAQLDITFENLILNVSQFSRSSDYSPMISNFSSPRWAMDLVIFSTENRSYIQEGFKYATHKSLDDEYTPGVFNIDEITTELSRSTKRGGYMQWRPVSYLTSKRDINYSTFPHINSTFPELDELDDSTTKSLAFAVFGEDLASDWVSTRSVIAFGQPKDGFYTEYNYTTWTVAYGVGSPPVEGFSDLIIIIISLGIGIPALVFVVGGIFVGCRKLRRTT